MQAGFKPKKFTKKEWQDNRSSACKGSGVGAALDLWQQHCTKPLSQMTEADFGRASATAQGLKVALDKAKKKCGPNQQETKAGIGEYEKKVAAFMTCLKKAADQQLKRKKFMKDVTHQMMGTDPDLQAAARVIAKSMSASDTLEAYFLFHAQKIEEMVIKYSAGDKYNIGGEANSILRKKFIDRVPVERNELLSALDRAQAGFIQMLKDIRVEFLDNAKYHQPLLEWKFPIEDYTV